MKEEGGDSNSVMDVSDADDAVQVSGEGHAVACGVGGAREEESSGGSMNTTSASKDEMIHYDDEDGGDVEHYVMEEEEEEEEENGGSGGWDMFGWAVKKASQSFGGTAGGIGFAVQEQLETLQDQVGKALGLPEDIPVHPKPFRSDSNSNNAQRESTTSSQDNRRETSMNPTCDVPQGHRQPRPDGEHYNETVQVHHDARYDTSSSKEEESEKSNILPSEFAVFRLGRAAMNTTQAGINYINTITSNHIAPLPDPQSGDNKQIQESVTSRRDDLIPTPQDASTRVTDERDDNLMSDTIDALTDMAMDTLNGFQTAFSDISAFTATTASITTAAAADDDDDDDAPRSSCRSADVGEEEDDYEGCDDAKERDSQLATDTEANRKVDNQDFKNNDDNGWDDLDIDISLTENENDDNNNGDEGVRSSAVVKSEIVSHVEAVRSEPSSIESNCEFEGTNCSSPLTTTIIENVIEESNVTENITAQLDRAEEEEPMREFHDTGEEVVEEERHRNSSSTLCEDIIVPAKSEGSASDPEESNKLTTSKVIKTSLMAEPPTSESSTPPETKHNGDSDKPQAVTDNDVPEINGVMTSAGMDFIEVLKLFNGTKYIDQMKKISSICTGRCNKYRSTLNGKSRLKYDKTLRKMKKILDLEEDGCEDDEEIQSQDILGVQKLIEDVLALTDTLQNKFHKEMRLHSTSQDGSSDCRTDSIGIDALLNTMKDSGVRLLAFQVSKSLRWLYGLCEMLSLKSDACESKPLHAMEAAFFVRRAAIEIARCVDTLTTSITNAGTEAINCEQKMSSQVDGDGLSTKESVKRARDNIVELLYMESGRSSGYIQDAVLSMAYVMMESEISVSDVK